MTPMRQPSSDSISASSRNWSSTSLRRAPIAIRMPISRVRSVTLTSMMFMMPMPPTMSEIDAMAASISVITSAVWAAESAIAARLRIWKSSS